MEKLEQLPWLLIGGLGALALIRPLLNVVGLMDGVGRPGGPLLVTALISLAWLLIVVLCRVRQPLLTLLWTGIAYGVFAIVMSAILSPLLQGEFMGPLTNPRALIAVLISNALWGGMVGIVAWSVLKVTQTK